MGNDDYSSSVTMAILPIYGTKRCQILCLIRSKDSRRSSKAIPPLAPPGNSRGEGVAGGTHNRALVL